MKTLLFSVLATMTFVVLTGFSPSASKKTAWLNGHWVGMKYQTNMDKAWKTDLTINNETGTYSISYPDLGCSGKLVLTSCKGKRAVFEEQIPNGQCLSGGTIIITKVDDRHLSFTCLRDAEQRLASYCTLEKQ